MFWGVNEQLEKRLKLKCKDIYICSRRLLFLFIRKAFAVLFLF